MRTKNHHNNSIYQEAMDSSSYFFSKAKENKHRKGASARAKSIGDRFLKLAKSIAKQEEKDEAALRKLRNVGQEVQEEINHGEDFARHHARERRRS